MLRREKKEVLKTADSSTSDAAGAAESAPGADGSSSTGAPAAAAKPSSMPHKNDLIVWLKLKPMQRKARGESAAACSCLVLALLASC